MASWVPANEAMDHEIDRLAVLSPASGFMQTSAWAEFKRSEGYRVHRLAWAEDDQVRGGASLLEFEGEGFVVCPEGPVLNWEDTTEARSALRSLCDYARSLGAMGLRIEPHLEAPGPRLLKNWSKSPVNLTPEHTLLVSLKDGPEAWLARMHPKTRYNLRLSQRHGVTVRSAETVADVRAFYSLFEETATRNGFFSEPLSFFINLYATLVPRGMAEFAVAEHEGRMLAAFVLIYAGRRATYLYGASSTVGRECMPNHALHGYAMQQAFDRGCEEYDLYGYDPFGSPDHLYAGISRFKVGWGGERRSWMGARDYVFYDALAERMVERLSGG